jgi:hypothetical protein
MARPRNYSRRQICFWFRVWRIGNSGEYDEEFAERRDACSDRSQNESRHCVPYAWWRYFS